MTHNNHQEEDSNLDDKRGADNGEIAIMQFRRQLALMLVGFIMIVALFAVKESGAMPILDKFLPALMLVVGFFFGQKSGQP